MRLTDHCRRQPGPSPSPLAKPSLSTSSSGRRRRLRPRLLGPLVSSPGTGSYSTKKDQREALQRNNGPKSKEVWENVTSVSLALRTAVTVRGVKRRWSGAEEQQSFSHSSTSCTSRALTGTSDPEPGPATTPSPRSSADASGSSADTGQTREVLSSQALHHHRQTLLVLTQFAGQ